MSKIDFVSPVGRLVQGNPFEAQTKNKAGVPLTTQTGQPRVSYFVGVAFPKNDPNFPALYQLMVQAARAGFPQLINAQGQSTHPRFAWKLMDGDGVDDDGKPNANKPGFAGCWVLKLSSGFAPKCFYAGRYAPQEQIQDPKAIPRGYYVRVAGTIEANGDPSKPGLYVNLSMVELVGGEPSMIIQSGPDASAVFGGAAPQLPPGVPPVAMGAPGNVPQMPMAQPGPTSYPGSAGIGAPPAAPLVQQPYVAPVAVNPNPGFLNGPGTAAPPQMVAQPGFPTPGGAPTMPQTALPATPGAFTAGVTSPTYPSSLPPMPGAMAAPVAPVHTMTAAAQGHSYEALVAQGWTDATLRQQGLML